MRPNTRRRPATAFVVTGVVVPPTFRHSYGTRPAVAAGGDGGEQGATFERRDVDRRGKRSVARARRIGGRILLVVPGLLLVAVDLALRRGAFLHAEPGDRLAYARASLMEIAFWGALVLSASARRGALRWVARGLLVTLGSLAVGSQIYAFGRYRAFLTTSSMFVGTAMLPSVRDQVWLDHATFFRAVMPPVVALTAIVVAQRKLAPPRARSRLVAGDLGLVLICVMGLYVPHTRSDHEASAPFATLYVRGVGQLARALWDKNPCLTRAHPGPRSPIAVAPLSARPKAPRNVLFVLTESVRASSACVAYDPECRTTPFSNAAAPERLPLLQMRSVDSTTAISLSVMWSGASPDASRAALHSAPLVWEYAKAADVDTAYWTSQNLLFGNSGAWLAGVPWGHHVSATELDPKASLETGADDGALITYVEADLRALHEPFLAVVHLANTHLPYAIDRGDAPFLPESQQTGSGHEPEIKNRYADAVYHQDRAVGRLLGALRAGPFGGRTVVVFLSDHGEQLFEKGGFGHTGTLFEPEIHIPAWVDAPPGTLDASEEASLRALRNVPRTTMDVLPTLLDLVGVLDDPGVAPFARTFVGRSWLRHEATTPEAAPKGEPVLLTNCSELWACAFKNWGAVAGTRKLVATEADHAWSCFDVADDPDELKDLGASACGTLPGFAETRMRGRPF